jgi:hypothetical protein
MFKEIIAVYREWDQNGSWEIGCGGVWIGFDWLRIGTDG